MKPVAIYRFFPIEGPGYFATFLNNNHIPWQLISVDAGDPLPVDVHSFSGLVLMGGLAPHIQPWLSAPLRSKIVQPAGDALDGAILLARQSLNKMGNR